MAKRDIPRDLPAIACEGWLPLATAMVGRGTQLAQWVGMDLRPVLGTSVDLAICPPLCWMQQAVVPHTMTLFFFQCRAHHYSSDGHEVGKKTTTSRQRGEPNKTKQTQDTTQNKQNQTPTNKGLPKSENQGETV